MDISHCVYALGCAANHSAQWSAPAASSWSSSTAAPRLEVSFSGRGGPAGFLLRSVLPVPFLWFFRAVFAPSWCGPRSSADGWPWRPKPRFGLGLTADGCTGAGTGGGASKLGTVSANRELLRREDPPLGVTHITRCVYTSPINHAPSAQRFGSNEADPWPGRRKLHQLTTHLGARWAGAFRLFGG